MKLLWLLLLLNQPAFIAKPLVRKTGKVYMGSVKDARGNSIYHVVSHFYTMQAARVLHGYNHVLFFNKKWQVIADYDVSMPENLPVLLKNNTLYFRQQDDGRRAVLHRQVINPATAPPAWLCVGVDGCYSK